MEKLTLDQLSALRGRTVRTWEGEDIGELDQVYYDEESGEPRWLEVKSGLFGLKQIVVPVEGAEVRDVELHLPYSKDQIESAPEPEEVKALSPRSERELERHFGVKARGEDGEDYKMVPFMRVVRVWRFPSAAA
jgi:sporulation protein YlmC with PRC-barrel domain